MTWGLALAIDLLLLAWLHVAIRDEWQAIPLERPVVPQRQANLRRAWIALQYIGLTGWLLAVAWLIWLERLAPVVAR